MIKEKEIIVDHNNLEEIATYIEKIELENRALEETILRIKVENQNLNKKLNFKLIKYAYRITMFKRRLIK